MSCWWWGNLAVFIPFVSGVGEIRAGWLGIWSHLTNFVCFFMVVTDLTSVENFIVFDGFVCTEAGVVVICSGSTDRCVGSWPEIRGAELWPGGWIRKQSLLTLGG